MVETAGTQLRRARALRQLSLEDVSRATKIRVAQLADLEADEFSNFANLAYARSFLVCYAKFLRVDVRSYVEGFADASTFGLDDYQYLSEKPVGVYRVPTRRARRRPRRGQLLLAGGAAALLTLAGLGWFAVASFQRLGDLDKLAARQEAQERARRGGSPEPAADAAASAPAAAAPAGEPAAPTDAPSLVPVAEPAASVPPPAAPMDDPLNAAIPALAVMRSAVPPAAGLPALLPPDEGVAVQPILAPDPAANRSPRASSRREEAKPRRVVNDRRRE